MYITKDGEFDTFECGIFVSLPLCMFIVSILIQNTVDHTLVKAVISGELVLDDIEIHRWVRYNSVPGEQIPLLSASEEEFEDAGQTY
jgi:hypothetical protein